MIKWIGSNLAKARQFIEVDIWRINLRNYSRSKYLLYKNFKILLITSKGFVIDKCAIKSSALTYFSLLSIVPLLAIAFAIAKSFNLEKYLEKQLRLLFANQEEIYEQSNVYAQNMLESTSGGLIAGIGAIFLLYTVINLLSNIESIFNEIWEVKKGRSLERKFTDYLSMMIAAPIIIPLASSVNAFIKTQAENFTRGLEFFNPFVGLLISLIPYVLFWFFFMLLYLIMPNTRVKVKPAMIAALITAVIYTVTQWGYYELQIGVSRYNAVYGSFAVLPLFLIWLQVSWMIVLLGAEFAFAYQNVMTWEYSSSKLRMSYTFKLKMALLIVHRIVKNFEEGLDPLSTEMISERVQAPIRFVNEVVRELVETKVINEVISGGQTKGYQPGIGTDKLTVQFFMDRLSANGLNNIHMIRSEEREKIEEALEQIARDETDSRGNVLLKNL